MAKQLNVNLAFTADTEKAKAQLQDLQNQLTKIINGSGSGSPLGITKEIQEATRLAAQLKVSLEGATNVNTGKLDLGKFNESLKKGQMTLGDYQIALNNLGPAGNKAFATLASSIMQAEIPIRRSNAALTEMLVTLKNTARWQISSSILHGFMGSIQSAYGYAQDLNESLNNIRIVTGYNIDQMSKFAEEANKAAKALSTTTTDYTNASLIYYQQGLTNEEVLERTDVTIKMANAAGQSAETVSDQMTAVWNNFDDGSKSLEYYADVMTALGAATASSTAEISDGLEKFAAVAETVGLSYEYATASLATITATTRQSADVVGNALKTLFARIQGLNLGETLDDGTTLNKYSEALEKVGISIFEQNGEMKEMDAILDEMGAKWNTLSKDQQTALAQTVAGVRQYTQLIALMDNWDYFQENLDVAINSQGTLQEQADIYAESWEAAEKRVQAAAERIYNSLLDEDFFIGFNNVLEFTLTGIGNLIDSMGGLPGVLAVLGTTLTTVFSKQMTASFDNLIYNIKMSTEAGRQSIEKLRNEANNLLISDFMDTDTTSGYTAANAYKEQGKAQQALIDNAKKLSEEEQKQVQYLLDQHNLLVNNVVKLGEEVEQEQKKTALAERRFNMNVRQATGFQVSNDNLKELKAVEQQVKGLNELYYKLSTVQIGGNNNSLKIFLQEIRDEFGEISTLSETEGKAFEKFGALGVQALKQLDAAFDGVTISAEDFDGIIDGLTFGTEAGAVNRLTSEILKLNNAEKGINITEAQAKKMAEELIQQYATLGDKTAQLTEEQIRLKNATSSVTTFLDQAKGPIQTLGAVITNSISVMTSFAMLLTSIKGMVDTLNNTEMTFGEKFFTIFTQMAFVLPNIASVVKNMTTLLGPTGFIGAINANKAAMALLNTEYDKNLIATLASTAAEKNKTKETLKGVVADKLGVDAATAETIATTLLTNAKMKETIATTKATVKQLALNAAHLAMKPAVWGTILVLGLATAAVYAYVQAQEADAKAAERAAKAAEELAEASNKAKNNANELKDAFNGYDIAIEKLEQVKGKIDEEAEALKNVNDEILNILEKYPDLAKMPDLFDNDGKFNENIIDNYIKEAEEKAKTAQMASIMASANASQAQANYQKNSLADDLELQLSGNDWLTSSGSSIYINGQEIVDELVNILNNPSIENNAQVFSEKLNSYAKDLGISETQQDLFTSALQKMAGEVDDVAKILNDAKTQINNVSLILATEYLGQSDTAGDKSVEWQESFNTAHDSYKVGNINRFSDIDTNSALQKLLTDAGIDLSTVSSSNSVIKENGVLKVQFTDGTLQTIESITELAATNTAINTANEQTTTGTGEGKENTIFSQLQSKGIVLNEGFSDTVAATDLLDRLNNSFINDENIASIITAINNETTASGQEDIINEILKIQSETKDQIDVASASEKYDLEAENVENYAESLLDLAEASEEAGDETNGVSADLKDNAKMASQVAVANSRMNKGLISLAENFDDYRKTLDANEQGTEEYQTALKGISDAMNDVLGLDDVELSDKFLTNTTNLDLMAQAANGSAEAVEALREAAAQDIIQNIELNDESFRAELITATQEFQTLLDKTDLSIGATFDNTEALTSLNELIEKSGMTAEQVQDYFNALGYTPELEYTEGTQKQHYQGIIPYLDANGNPDYKPYDFEVEETVQIPTIKSLTYHGDAGRTINTGAIKKAGGSSSSKPTKVDKTKKSDIVDRYKEVNDQIDDLENSLDDANKAADRLFGKDRVKALEKERDLLKDQIPLLEKKRDEAKAYLAIDKQLLMDTGKKYGITFETDGAGNITNYTEELTKLYNELAAAEEKMNNMSTKDAQDAYKEATLDPLNEKINELKDAIAQYDETRELLEDLEDEITDAFNAWQDKNYEILTYKLEIELELNEADLQEIEFELSLLEDDFYKMAEAAALMKDQIDPLNDSLTDLDNHFEDLTDAYEDGKISQADYIDGLKETRDSIYDQLNALVDLDKEMMNYYGDTLDAAMEELDKYTDHMEHLTGVIDHYISLMELMGKSTDFKTMDEFLSARAETTKNELDVAKSNYEMLKRNSKADEYYENYQKALADGDQDMAEWWKTQWEAEIKILDEAQDEMLSKTEEWMEAMKAVIENNMNKAAKSLEDALTNGMSFDHMMTELDRLNERQEEYLTKTNQVYETNKLMRAAAQAADKTDNAVAKQKFKNFAEETKQLQEKGQLSKYELEIQQAKYDLLLAEIALEDAQNAKSTVRLQRDSEGNFGYVYTADQDKISEAQQAVEDAENDLYNISLNGQQEYTEKYTQALQTMYDELGALQEAYLNGDIATEQEYQARKEALMQHYFGTPDGILTTYSNLYNIAVQTDANATADFWATSYGNMTQNTSDFKDAVNSYLVEVEDETETWHEITKEAQDDITEGLDDLVDESEEYADVVDDEVIPAIEDEIQAVQDLTDEYADQRDEILRLIQTYKELIRQINEAIAAAARQNSSSRSSTGDLSRDAAIAVTKGEDASDIVNQRADKMATGDHPNVVDQDTFANVISAAQGGDDDAMEIVEAVASGKKKYTDFNLDEWKDSAFATGGYTGEWGPQAKLAFVHEKEIMLNSDDTVNFLSAIKITRSIMELIDKQAGWASAGLGMMSASGVQDYNQVLEQEVTIHAEFPNATDHNEIEEAFNNLMNTASQYANRKNR